MAYIDLTIMTDRYAKSIILKDPAFAQVALGKAEVDTRVAARGKEVKAEDIPLTDPDEFIQSEMLYIFCEWRFLYHLFKGVAVSVDDIYSMKMMEAKQEASDTKEALTYEIITELEVVDSSQRDTGIRIL